MRHLDSKPPSTTDMLAFSKILVAVACFSCSLAAFGQENFSLEDLFNVNQESASGEAADSIERLVPISFEDLPFSENDLDFRKWSDATGKFSVIGRFEGFGNGTVLLVRKDNRKEVKVKVALLAAPDVELLDSIKKNIKTVEQFRKQKEVTDLFADTYKLMSLLEELRGQMERLARENTRKDDDIVRKKRATLRVKFLEKLLAMKTATIPASMLSISSAEEEQADPEMDMRRFVSRDLWGEGWGSNERFLLVIVGPESELQFGKLFKTIKQDRLVKIQFSGKPRRFVSEPTVWVLGGLSLNQGRFDGVLDQARLGSALRIYHRASPFIDYVEDRDGDLRQPIWARISLARGSVDQVDHEFFQRLLQHFKSSQIVNETYDWWGYFGNTLDQRKELIATAKWLSMCNAINSRLQKLSGKGFDFDTSVIKEAKSVQPKMQLFSYPLDPNSNAWARCSVLTAEINRQTGEHTMVISLPAASNKVELESSSKAWYSFRYQPSDFDGLIDLNGNFIIDGKPGELVAEKLLTP